MSERLSELELMAQIITGAKNPEEVFGGLVDEKQVYSVYRQLAKLTHPDVYTNPAERLLAQNAFSRLTQLWGEAKLKINGVAEEPEYDEILIQNRSKDYLVTTRLFSGEIFNFYPCTLKGEPRQLTFKINQDPLHTDKLKNEAEVLTKLSETPNFAKFQPYFPQLIDSFPYIDPGDALKRQVNILSQPEGFYSLKEVKDSYSDGLDPKDMAWIWRRLLFGLGIAHQNDIVHGAILPQNILIHPEKHGLMIAEWSNAFPDFNGGGKVEPITENHKLWYPPEVTREDEEDYKDLNKPTPGLDIYMGVKNMAYLLNGDPKKNVFPGNIHPKLRSFFNGTALEAPRRRPQNAWELLEEFDELIVDIWGPKKFHPFSMPKRASKISFW